LRAFAFAGMLLPSRCPAMSFPCLQAWCHNSI
jgi:hypothetical protein